jgi:hypothetical protein
MVEWCWWNGVGGMVLVEWCWWNGVGGMVLVELCWWNGDGKMVLCERFGRMALVSVEYNVVVA